MVLIGRDEPTRHFWASTAPPPERLTLWRGNGGVDWEREYVPAEQLRGAVDVERIARVLAEHVSAMTVRAEAEPAYVCRFHRDLARAIVEGQ